MPGNDEARAAEIEKFRSHSVILNRILWRMQESMGAVGPDDKEAFGDPDELAERFFGAHSAMLAALQGILPWIPRADAKMSMVASSKQLDAANAVRAAIALATPPAAKEA